MAAFSAPFSGIVNVDPRFDIDGGLFIPSNNKT
jgi:hypothetical protein